jgi:hypothetical protein
VLIAIKKVDFNIKSVLNMEVLYGYNLLAVLAALAALAILAALAALARAADQVAQASIHLTRHRLSRILDETQARVQDRS